MALLAWIGRQRTRAVAALVLIGLFSPTLGALLKPYITEAVFVLLCIAFFRIDFTAAKSHIHRPGLVLAASVWTTFAIPLLFALGCVISGVNSANPALFLALMLQAVASPMMAAPAFAALMGLDATLVLVSFVISTALTPFSAPVFAFLMGLELPLSPFALGLKLFGILAGSAVIGLICRRITGSASIENYRDEIDGVNILILFVFIAAVMGDVSIWLLVDPVLVLGLTAFAFCIFILMLAVSYFVFLKTGEKHAFAIAMMSSQRNMGLMLAGTGGLVPDLTWLYIAVGQFPIYLSPQMLQPVADRINKREM